MHIVCRACFIGIVSAVFIGISNVKRYAVEISNTMPAMKPLPGNGLQKQCAAGKI
jgi:hypothetical protein